MIFMALGGQFCAVPVDDFIKTEMNFAQEGERELGEA